MIRILKKTFGRAGLVVALSTCGVPPAFAQTAEMLTWTDCVRQARDANPTLVAARESVESSRYQYRAQKALYLPTLSGSAGYSKSDNPSDRSGVQDHTSAGLDAEQTVFAGYGNRARVRQAESQVVSAEADWSQAQADVGADLRRAFVRLLYAQAQIDLSRSIAERRKQNLDLVQLRFDVGKEHKGSLLRSDASYQQALFDVEQAKRAIRVGQRELATALGRNRSDELTAEGELTVPPPEPEPDLPPAMRLTPRHRRAAAQLDASRAAEDIARSPFYPELSLRASASRSGDAWPPDQDQWSAGLALSFPFFSGRRDINTLAAAKSDVRRAEANEQKEDQDVLFTLESAWAALQDAIQQRDVDAAFLQAAEVRAEIARTQYANGLISFQDWDTIENDLIQAQKAKLASDRDAALTAASWDQVRGLSVFTSP